MLRRSQQLVALARGVVASICPDAAPTIYGSKAETLGRVFGSRGATTSAGQVHAQANAGSSVPGDPLVTANLSYTSLTPHQVRRMEVILMNKQKLEDINKSKAAARAIGPDLVWPVRKWVPLLMNGSDELEREDATLPGRLFNRFVNPRLLHLAVRWQMAKRRAGTHSTKTRAEVRGGGRKPWKQKGTGRARQGSIRAPQWRGGGITHGPKPRDYSFKMNKMARRAALRAAVAAKVQAGQLILVDRLALTDAEAGMLLERRLQSYAHELGDLNVDKVKHAGLGLRQWIIETLSQGGISLPDPLPAAAGDGAAAAGTAPVADVPAIMRALLEANTSYAEAQAKTGVFRQDLQRLLPPGWDTLPNSMLQSNSIVRVINGGMSEERLDMQERQRTPNTRRRQPSLSVLILDSSKDGADGGALLRRSTANIPRVDVLPVVGANVLDVLNHDFLIMTIPALVALQDRVSRPLNRGFKPLKYSLAAWIQQEEARKAEARDRQRSFPGWLRERTSVDSSAESNSKHETM